MAGAPIPTPDQASEALDMAQKAETMLLELIDDLFSHFPMPQRLVDKHAAFKAATTPTKGAA